MLFFAVKILIDAKRNCDIEDYILPPYIHEILKPKIIYKGLNKRFKKPWLLVIDNLDVPRLVPVSRRCNGVMNTIFYNAFRRTHLSFFSILEHT
jgi:hypothetical protein